MLRHLLLFLVLEAASTVLVSQRNSEMCLRLRLLAWLVQASVATLKYFGPLFQILSTDILSVEILWKYRAHFGNMRSTSSFYSIYTGTNAGREGKQIFSSFKATASWGTSLVIASAEKKLFEVVNVTEIRLWESPCFSADFTLNILE